MFRYVSFLILSAGLAACGPLSPPSNILPPSVFAERTVLDEQAALGVELAYQAQALSVRTALRSGLLTGANAAKAAAIDAKAYAALKLVRSAYDAGNAQDYVSALLEARNLVTQSINLLKGS